MGRTWKRGPRPSLCNAGRGRRRACLGPTGEEYRRKVRRILAAAEGLFMCGRTETITPNSMAVGRKLRGRSLSFFEGGSCYGFVP